MTMLKTFIAENPDPYWFRARYVKTIDGDTVELDIDAGFHLTARHRVRILGIDTPELRAKDPAERKAAQAAKLATENWFLSALLPTKDPEWPFIVRTEKADSFGRYLAEVRDCSGDSLAMFLLSDGHAKVYQR